MKIQERTRAQIEKETREILKSINKMPPFSSVIIKILQVIKNEDYDVKELEELISLDPIITVKCLKLCNSSYFGMRKKISSIQQAIVVLGQKNLVKVVMVAATGSLNFTTKGLWTHSISVAILCQLIYDAVLEDKKVKKNFDSNSEFILYTSALLHDIGRIVLDQFIEKDFAEIELLHLNGVFKMIDIERKLYGVDHAIIGAEILKRWGFPEELILPVRSHHIPFKTIPKKLHIVHILTLADLMHFSFIWDKNYSNVVIDAEVLNCFNFKQEDLNKFKYQLFERLGETKELLNIDTDPNE